MYVRTNEREGQKKYLQKLEIKTNPRVDNERHTLNPREYRPRNRGTRVSRG